VKPKTSPASLGKNRLIVVGIEKRVNPKLHSKRTWGKRKRTNYLFGLSKTLQSERAKLEIAFGVSAPPRPRPRLNNPISYVKNSH
jgi:hypothetical protein